MNQCEILNYILTSLFGVVTISYIVIICHLEEVGILDIVLCCLLCVLTLLELFVFLCVAPYFPDPLIQYIRKMRACICNRNAEHQPDRVADQATPSMNQCEILNYILTSLFGVATISHIVIICHLEEIGILDIVLCCLLCVLTLLELFVFLCVAPELPNPLIQYIREIRAYIRNRNAEYTPDRIEDQAIPLQVMEGSRRTTSEPTEAETSL